VLTLAAPLPWPQWKVVDLGGDGFDFDYDPGRRMIYVSIPSRNEVVYVSATSGSIVQRHFVGLKPMGIDYAPYADRVYVALNQSGAVAEVNPDTHTVSEIVVGGSNGLGSSLAFDVVEGDPNDIFVSANPGSGGFSYIAKIDRAQANTVSRVASGRIIRASPIFQQTSAGDFLYVGQGFSPNSLYKLDLSQPAAPIVLEDQHGSVSGTRYLDASPDGQQLYLLGGQVLRADSFLQSGRIGTGIPRVNESGGAIYMINPNPTSVNGLRTYDARTFLQTGAYDLPVTFPSGITQFDLLPNDAGLVVLGSGKLLVAVPEPSTLALLAIVALGLALAWRRRTRPT
jgi:hypothetical protein